MKKNSILPALVLLFSFLELSRYLSEAPNWLRIINAAIGIFAAILFFKNNEHYRKLINTWIYLQLIVITKTSMGFDEPVIDFTQFVRVKLGFSMGSDSTSYHLDFNVISLAYLILFNKLQMGELVGKQLNLKLYRANEVLNAVLPQTITVLELINYPKSGGWFLSRLSTPIPYNNKTFEYCLIRSKDDVPIVPNRRAQMAHLRLVDDITSLKDRQLQDFEFIDWVFVS